MASKHLRVDRGQSRVKLPFIAATIAVAVAAVAIVVAMWTSKVAPVVAEASAAVPSATQSLSQEGRLVAVSPTSVTAESADGFARTYVIDAQTNAITPAGSMVGHTAAAFAVNDEVAIVGVVRDGTAVATAVAAKAVANLDGPPMDAA